MYEFHKLKIKNIHQETPNAVVLTLDIAGIKSGDFTWQAGQHLTFRKYFDGEEIRRNYSIFNPINDDEIQVLVKKVTGGCFSEAAQTELCQGEEIEVMPPTGKFVLQAANDSTYVFFAAGSGITPILAMIYAVLGDSNSHVILYYGNSTVESTLLKNQLADLKDSYPDRFSISYFLSQDPVDVDLYSGRIDADKVNKLYQHELKNLRIAGYYLCGPGDMINQLKASLQELGVAKNQLHSELFLVEGLNINKQYKTAKQNSGVSVTMDGVTLNYAIKQGDSKTLLEAGLEAGIKMPYSCQAGVCATCRCKLVEGEVEMLENYCLEDWELQDGYILACQSIPKTKKIILDYDS